MKIAFHVARGDPWQAGLAHLQNFIFALKQTYGNDLTLCLLAPRTKSARYSIPNDLSQQVDEIIDIPAFERWTALWAMDLAVKLTFSRDVRGSRALRSHRIDVIFGMWIQYTYDKIPTLSWIPDFQHVHLPEMFSARERVKRDQAFLRTAKLSTRIVLMSESVKKDFQAFAPSYAHKARVLKTASRIPASVYEVDPKFVVDQYHLPDKFFYLPNQFWKHKNHELVFQALKILKDRGSRIFVACSGYQGDYRHPSYFSDLLQKVSRWGIRDQIAFLGLIPRYSMFQLMRQSVCVLNPSLFEGFGLTIDEARSVGKQVIMSDILAHREQNPPGAVFFDPQDCEGLAQKLEKIWYEIPPGPDMKLESEARQSLPGRIRACAESFMSVVREVINR